MFLGLEMAPGTMDERGSLPRRALAYRSIVWYSAQASLNLQAVVPDLAAFSLRDRKLGATRTSWKLATSSLNLRAVKHIADGCAMDRA